MTRTEITKRDLFVSVIVYLNDNGHLVDSFTEELVEVLIAHYSDFEIIFVDDGSTDHTAAVMEQILRRHEGIRYVRLTRKFGREASVYAALQSAIGDYMVVMSIQTDPPTLIPALVDRLVSHGGIVYGSCDHRLNEGPLFRWVRSLYVWITIHLFRIPLAKNATQLIGFSRQALNAYLEIKDRFRHTLLLTAYVGYPQESFDYRQVPRSQEVDRRSLREGISTGIRIIFAYSSFPLRATAWTGVIAALTNLILTIAYPLIHESLGDSPLSANVSLQNAVMFFVLTGVLAVFAEYVSSLIEESRHRPLYYLYEEKTSSVLHANQDRRNITT